MSHVFYGRPLVGLDSQKASHRYTAAIQPNKGCAIKTCYKAPSCLLLIRFLVQGVEGSSVPFSFFPFG